MCVYGGFSQHVYTCLPTYPPSNPKPQARTNNTTHKRETLLPLPSHPRPQTDHHKHNSPPRVEHAGGGVQHEGAGVDGLQIAARHLFFFSCVGG